MQKETPSDGQPRGRTSAGSLYTRALNQPCRSPVLCAFECELGQRASEIPWVPHLDKKHLFLIAFHESFAQNRKREIYIVRVYVANEGQAQPRFLGCRVGRLERVDWRLLSQSVFVFKSIEISL